MQVNMRKLEHAQVDVCVAMCESECASEQVQIVVGVRAASEQV